MCDRRACPIPAVSAVIVQNGTILLVKRGDEPNRGLWSLPGGHIELGETARDALAREVLEETSLQVEVGEVASVHDVISREGDRIAFHYVIVSFFATVTGGSLRASSDAAEARWIALGDVRKLQTTAGLSERLRSMAVLP
jgi:8-oxo-dGTP diphosphatase